uniref:Putative secreted protein n=1 Tax=Panstrongylus lignarius TaxID=156445 RepID=A0A224Y0L5_9HEMI
MANTFCVVLVATLFVSGFAVQPYLGLLKGYIHRKSGETRGVLNQQLGLAANEVNSRVTTDEQRACVNNQLRNLFAEGNAEVGLATKRLMNLAVSHSASLPSTPTADVYKVVDFEFAKVVNELPHKVEELNKCLG